MLSKWVLLLVFCALALAACAGTGDRKEIVSSVDASAEYMERQRIELQVSLGHTGGVEVAKIDKELYVTLPCDALFESGSDRINPAASRQVDGFATVMNKYAGTQVKVDAHSDCLRSEEENLEITESQAGALKEALVARGIVPARIRARGWGEAKPVATNATEDGRKSNRRVVMTLSPTPTELLSVK
ncbi:MAG: OmpA family protein [Desulfobacteraceae bacterium]|nr:OmpA family protein [Desulfobacteraceae bacterium]